MAVISHLNAVTSHLISRALPMLQVRNYHVSYRLRAWSLLDMSVTLRDVETTFSANQISCCSLNMDIILITPDLVCM